MIKESEVEVTKTEKRTEYFCDLCGKTYSFMYTSRSCTVCGRDVCSNCSIMTDDMITEDVCSDYPSKICNLCWNLKEFKDGLNDLVGQFESDKGELYSKWKQKSLKE